MGRPRVFLVAALLVAVACLGAAGSGAAADARLTVTDATVSPDTPAAGAPVTVDATVQLSAGSNTSLDLDSVRVVGEGETLAEATDLGTLSPGESLTVPVTLTVDQPRVHEFEVVATGTDEDGERARAARPLTVGVERASPQLELRTGRLVAGADRPVVVNVSNPTTAALRGLDLRVTGPVEGSERRTLPALPAGATETVTLPARALDPGAAELTVRAGFTGPTGDRRTTTASRPVTVAEASVDVGVRVAPAETDGGGQVPGGLGGVVGGDTDLQPQTDDTEDRVDVTVTNFGNTAVEDVAVSGRADGAVLDSVGRVALADRLDPGESAATTVDLSTAGGDAVAFVASYDTPDGRAETELMYDRPTSPANATVTGLDVTREDGVVRVEGNLANTGDGEVTGAVVEVSPDRWVTPAYPQRSYFVGSVAGGEFVPFEVTADADPANATDVTLRVSYGADGDRTTETVRAPLPAPEEDGGGLVSQSPLPVALVVGVTAIGVVAAIGYRARR